MARESCETTLQAYGNRQDDFSYLGAVGQREIIAANHAEALMMNAAKDTLRAGTQVVIMGGGVWGKGHDTVTAKRAFTAHGGRLRFGYGVYVFGPGSDFRGIDDTGRLHYHGDAPTFTEIASRKR